jgi:hypothetical protein
MLVLHTTARVILIALKGRRINQLDRGISHGSNTGISQHGGDGSHGSNIGII